MSVHDRLVDATAALIRRNGVAGTGLAEILQCSGVARRSVYLNFPGGKEELVAAATREVGASMTALLRAGTPVAGSVRDFVDLWAARLRDSGFADGCPIVAAALGRHSAGDAADAAGAVFEDWTAALVSRLREEGYTASDARDIATMAIVSVEGAVVVAQARRSAEPLEVVGRVLEEIVNARRPG